VGTDDKVVLWGGGIYNWFDPLTLVRAIDLVRHRVPEVRLVFMGTQHPNPDVPRMRMAAEAERLADALRLRGRHVFFNRGWVPYAERANVLLDADVGVSTHLDHVETAYSFRTRVLDYLWASLPIVCTSGDALADAVHEGGLGRTVGAGDVDGLAAALLELLTDPDAAAVARSRIRATSPDYQWARVLQPLGAFCARPRRAPDLLDPTVVAGMAGGLTMPVPRWRGVGGDLRLARDHLARGGVALLVSRAVGRVRRLLRGELRPRD
jgi:glycosyltransferase involved in cell wall biosynthesis